MFEPLIDQARDLIQRLHAGADKAREAGTATMPIRPSEFEAWGTAAQGIIGALFGADSPALARWLALGERQSQLISESVRSDGKRGEYFGLIDYFHLAIGLMTELEVAYRAGATQARPAPAGQFADQLGASVPATPQHAPPAADPPGSLAIDLRPATYEWLEALTASRTGMRNPDRSSVAQVAGAILEQVIATMRRGQRAG